MPKSFAQINCSLLRSRKMKGLSHEARWAYICAHVTQLGGFTGTFVYPEMMWASDAALGPEQWTAAVQSLCKAGLLEWSAEDEVVRIIGFHTQRPPENAKRAIGLVTDFHDDLRSFSHSSGVVLRAAAEFAVAAVTRAQAWKPDSADLPKLRDALRQFLRVLYDEFEETLSEALLQQMEAANKSARGELFSLLPALEYAKRDTLSIPYPKRSDTLSIPYGNPIETRDLDETRRDLDQDEEKDEDETRDFSANSHHENSAPVEESELLRSGSNTTGLDPKHSRPRPETLRSPLASGAG